MTRDEIHKHLEFVEARTDELAAILETDKGADPEYTRQVKAEMMRLFLDHQDHITKLLY